MSGALALPVRVELGSGLSLGDDGHRFWLHLTLMGVPDGQLWVELEVAAGTHPRVVGCGRDDFGMLTDLRDRLVIALYDRLYPLLPPARAVHLSDPDLRPWLEHTFYHAHASRLARLIAARASSHTQVLIHQPVITRHFDRPSVQSAVVPTAQKETDHVG